MPVSTKPRKGVPKQRPSFAAIATQTWDFMHTTGTNKGLFKGRVTGAIKEFFIKQPA